MIEFAAVSYVLFAVLSMLIMLNSDAGRGKTPMSRDDVLVGSLFVSMIPVLQQIVVIGYIYDNLCK